MIERRTFLTSLTILPLFGQRARLKIVVAGGHPGDPECGCGGTIAKYAALGHQVVLLYMNRGEGYCGGAELARCGAIRTAEAGKACEILKAKAAFAGQVDGQAVVDDAHYAEFGRILTAEKPDVVFTQWPIDEHRDHRALSQLAIDAWLKDGRKWALYYYEVADDTQMFAPTEFVDISDEGVLAVRRAACYAHASQLPEKWFPRQVALTGFRGAQSGFRQAEAFVRHWQSVSAVLP